MTLERLTVDMFSDKVGHAFFVEMPDVPAVELKLTEVTPLQNYRKAPREPFSLMFTGPGGLILPQRRYALRHAALGPQWMFLVPVAGNKDKVTYQAIFN
jgi:hypothetical protein